MSKASKRQDMADISFTKIVEEVGRVIVVVRLLVFKIPATDDDIEGRVFLTVLQTSLIRADSDNSIASGDVKVSGNNVAPLPSVLKGHTTVLRRLLDFFLESLVTDIHVEIDTISDIDMDLP